MKILLRMHFLLHSISFQIDWRYSRQTFDVIHWLHNVFSHQIQTITMFLFQYWENDFADDDDDDSHNFSSLLNIFLRLELEPLSMHKLVRRLLVAQKKK